MKSFSSTYRQYITSDKWRKKSSRYRSYCNCCLFPWLKPKDAHHLSYRNLGKEKFWIDVLPLSRTAHNIVGCRLLWNSGKPDHIPRIVVNYYLRFIGFPIALLFRLVFK